MLSNAKTPYQISEVVMCKNIWKWIKEEIWYKRLRKPLEVGIKWLFPLIITSTVLLLQFTPLLTVSGISGGFSDTGKIYFYINNLGSMPAYEISGRFAIVSIKEKDLQTAEKEKVIGGNIMDTGRSVVFYPTGKSGASIPLMYPAKIKNAGKMDHIFLAIYFKYPQYRIFPIKKRIYEGVFQYAPDKNAQFRWVQSSQTMFPDLFEKIFDSLRKGKA